MSTLKVENLLNKDSLSNNIVLNSDGTLTTGPTTVTGSQATVTLVDTDRTNNTYSSAVWGDQDANLHLVADYEGTAGNRFISLRVGGTSLANEKMRINAGGNVGIGTNNPTEKLDVRGRAYIENNGVNYARIGTTYSGHYFESQSWDTYDGFEIYQQHGSNTTRNSFIVNDNRTGSKSAAFAVRGDGVILAPSQPAFGASSGTGHGNTTGVITNWGSGGGTIYCNNGNHFNGATGVFTAPVAGTYCFVGGVMGGDSSYNWWYFRRNGNMISSHHHTDSLSGKSYQWSGGGVIVTLSANDAIDMYTRTLYSNAAPWHEFSGYLIG